MPCELADGDVDAERAWGVRRDDGDGGLGLRDDLAGAGRAERDGRGVGEAAADDR